MNVLDLFSGIGGFSLGLERAGMTTIAFCENDKHAQKILKKHWPDVPIFEDVKKLNNINFGKVDLICGGFPCQPFSTASRGRIVAEDLWPYMANVIFDKRPKWVIAENVQSKPINKARFDLEKMGYNCETRNIGADDCGADHQRNRWWLVAHSDNKSEFSSAINAEVALLPELCKGVWGAENYARTIRVSNGLSNRMDRLKRLGNAVIPQIPEAIGRAIINYENMQSLQNRISFKL